MNKKEFHFKQAEDMTDLANTIEIEFGFRVFASYLKFASVFQIHEKHMWLPTDMIYDDINHINNIASGLDENTQDEDLHDLVHAYVDAYVEKGIFEKSVLTDRFRNAMKDTPLKCDEMVRMVNPEDLETLRRFAKLISVD
ncbi:hypothetical protein [Methanosarcina mazei]|uniref:Uncharacterized protein n=1 Tax=Methanosarcina mazei TaxID=2209 RepID=A0A0F8QLV4_METMZ|nr:hypothetical protein [Methanosarcina mazei]KKH38982.1 hypothetical protein DU71_01360 [Methanosarcina mazei]KKH43586.1 hypothetical protein DU72_00030 [Methanosarcina mazei]QIB91267.1 hypothetical protein FQU78_09650 [Methanosarcina mazei]